MFTISLGNWNYLLTASKTWHWASVKALHDLVLCAWRSPGWLSICWRTKHQCCTMLENLLKGLWFFFQQTLSCNHHQVSIIKVFIQTGSSSPPSWAMLFVFSSWMKTWNTSKQQSIKNSCDVKCVSTTCSKRLPDLSIIWLGFSLNSELKILSARPFRCGPTVCQWCGGDQQARWAKLPSRMWTKDGPKLDNCQWIN